MRVVILMGLLALAACGESESGSGGNKAASASRAAAIEPGQWELASEVTGFDRADEGAPRIDTPVGTRAVESVCVGAGGRLPATLFAGAGYECDYGNYYVRNGRVNVTMNCLRDGLEGSVPMTVDGSFAARSLDYRRNLRTILVTDGDVEIDARVTGRRTGDCTPAAADGEGEGEGEGAAK